MQARMGDEKGTQRCEYGISTHLVGLPVTYPRPYLPIELAHDFIMEPYVSCWCAP